MKHAFFGDIHSNFDALQAVLADTEVQHADKMYCLGDIVGYGAEPRECIGRIRELDCPAVMGNHDHAAATDVSLDNFNEYARTAILWTRDQLAVEEKKWLAERPFVIHYEEFSIVHASLLQPESFRYLMLLADASDCLNRMEAHLCFVGHSHVPSVFFDAVPGRPAGYRYDLDDTIAVRGKMIINPGSVGQPRDGDPRAGYCIYDDVTQHVAFRRLTYDATSAASKIRAAGLPPVLAWRLEIGR